MIKAATCLLVPMPALLFFAQGVQAAAETLSDADIRSLYARVDAAVPDADKSHSIMQERFDENIAVTIQSTQVIGNSLPKTQHETMTKAQVIDADKQTRGIVKITGHNNTIHDIKYSADKESAYVSNTSTSEGRMNIPLGNGKSLPADYTDSLSCLDTLALKNGVIRLVKSDCQELTKLKKPSN